MKYLVIFLISINAFPFVTADVARKQSNAANVKIGIQRLREETEAYKAFIKQVEDEVNAAIRNGHSGAYIHPKYIVLERHRKDLVHKLEKLGYKTSWTGFPDDPALSVTW
jgi:hypothetical protein